MTQSEDRLSVRQWVIAKIISGGQTGADRAALDWAIAHGLPHGGWCPRGRLAEDGTIDSVYRLQETTESDYNQRTEWNVRDADATLIVSESARLSGGSLFTAQIAKSLGKPCLHLSGTASNEINIKRLGSFLRRHCVQVLNVAGPCASTEPKVGRLVSDLLDAALAPRK